MTTIKEIHQSERKGYEWRKMVDYHSSLSLPLMWFWQGFLFALQSPRKKYWCASNKYVWWCKKTTTYINLYNSKIHFDLCYILILRSKVEICYTVYNALHNVFLSFGKTEIFFQRMKMDFTEFVKKMCT